MGLIHLLICREYPPAAYPPGGIGTYAREISAALARAGECVHVIAHRWAGAPLAREDAFDGRLIVHRVAMDDPGATPAFHDVPEALLASPCPAQAFAWQAALLAERLVEHEGIDVIEAQEWEAPLAYLQLRRAAGLGPARRPPCVVHIHSPSERIFAANQWDTSVSDFAPLAALEAYSITRADAVLCPSRFIAAETTERYRLEPARVTVVPYPRGTTAVVEREEQTWADGAICHVGRLEPRKGVLEWAEAIALVAAEHPEARFDFVGGDTPLAVVGGRTVGAAMRDRLPTRTGPAVRFRGTQSPQGVIEALREARIAVVPSRWENFPYSCIESMSSGLPVIVSPHGGMRELVEDGVSGWIATDGSPAALASALRRALTVGPAQCRAMGQAAAARVRQVCDEGVVVARHLVFKRGLREAHARAASTAAAPGVRLAAIVVGSDAELSENTRATLAASRAVAPSDIHLAPPAVPGERAEHAAVRTAGAVIARESTIGAVAFIEAGVRPDSDALARAAAWFGREATLGLVGAWTRRTAPRPHVELPPLVNRPHVLEDGVATPIVFLRRAALDAAAESLGAAGDRAVAEGWAAATYPTPAGTTDRCRGRGPIRRRFSSMAGAVQRLHMPLWRWLWECSASERHRFLADAVRHPQRAVAGVTALVARRQIGRINHAARPSDPGPVALPPRLSPKDR